MNRFAAGCADSVVMFRRVLRRTVRGRDTLLVSALLPILLMLLFVYVFGGAIQVGMPYLEYVLPGIVLLCTGFGASITATGVATDVQGAAVDRFRTLPIYRQALLAGHALEGVVRNLGVVAVVFGVALVLGFRTAAGLPGLLTAAGVVLLLVVAVTWIAVAMGLLARTPEAAGGFTYAIMFVPYVSSAFVRTESMPPWLRGFADHQPATPILGAIRGALTGAGGGVVPAVLWCAGLGLAGYIGAAALFAHRGRD
ncbi:ABC transporter permease [Nocardia sp. NPDC050697]|uniref:ABC transporter permease n=1 Tax=Nocardia sp. NPDC050697 TaxID=3155158 RepID=UPI003402570D